MFLKYPKVNELPLGNVHECSVPSHFGLIAGLL
nr:MAG TPA: calcium-binding and coiled-coil domain-containing protein [Caudoviricetes sp.]DAZ03479.1 MAG TPA: calcium-binding and coiled-coil domain-containing protein [Caudoviricetes sp.]